MTSIKLKFRPSANPDREGSLIFQLIHERTIRRIKSMYKIFNDEWDKDAEQILIPPSDTSRFNHLQLIAFNVNWEMRRFKRIADAWAANGRGQDIDDIVKVLHAKTNDQYSVFKFINAQIQHKKLLGKVRSSETYQATLNSFMRFRKGVDLSFDMIDSELIELYEAELRGRGLTRNTTSFYMRILRAIYKLSIEKGLTMDRMPFRNVYCGIDKTVKRSISLTDIKKIKELELPPQSALDYSRDMFLFSFYTRGMSFVDMAYLKKKDLRNGYLSYRRKKTGQLLTIEWTRQMQEILNKYAPSSTQYLLPIIIDEDGTERRQYQNQMMKINRHLKDIAKMIRLSVPLSLYYSRHSWATIARGKSIPISVISEGLGHDSEATTQIYLDSIKCYEVDKANRKILKEL